MVVKTTTRKVKVLELKEKAVSKKQQRFFGMVRAAQKGEGAASPEVAKVAGEISKKDAKDFAKTKHKGLPEKKTVKETSAVFSIGGRANTAIRNDERKKKLERIDKTVKAMRKRKDFHHFLHNPKGGATTADLRGEEVVVGQAESFEIDKSAHKKVQRQAKIRNLAKGNKNPNEKSAAESKLKGPKLAWEDFKQEINEREDSPYERASSGALKGKTRNTEAKEKEHKTSFRRKAHRNSAAMIIRAKRKAERSGKKLSDDSAGDLAHKGWASSVKHHKSSMTPEQQKRRQKLADTPYSKLSKDEQDKDKVSAKAIMSVHDKQKKK